MLQLMSNVARPLPSAFGLPESVCVGCCDFRWCRINSRLKLPFRVLWASTVSRPVKGNSYCRVLFVCVLADSTFMQQSSLVHEGLGAVRACRAMAL